MYKIYSIVYNQTSISSQNLISIKSLCDLNSIVCILFTCLLYFLLKSTINCMFVHVSSCCILVDSIVLDSSFVKFFLIKFLLVFLSVEFFIYGCLCPVRTHYILCLFYSFPLYSMSSPFVVQFSLFLIFFNLYSLAFVFFVRLQYTQFCVTP